MLKKAGLIFSVGTIAKQVKERMRGFRFDGESFIYITAVLEYLAGIVLYC